MIGFKPETGACDRTCGTVKRQAGVDKLGSLEFR